MRPDVRQKAPDSADLDGRSPNSKYDRPMSSEPMPRSHPSLGIRRRDIGLAVLVILLSIAVVSIVGFATRTGREAQVAGVAAAMLVVLLSFRWPLIPLFGLVVLIPIEEAVLVGDIGSLSRYAAILFLVAFGIPRIGRLTIRAMPLPGWAYVSWALFSTAWALDAAVTWIEIPAMILLFLTSVMIAIAVVERPTIVRPLLWAYSISAAATAVVAIYIFATSGGSSDRISAISGQNPAFFAAILLPAAMFGLYELLNGRRIFASGAITLLCTIAIVASGTRGAWVSAAVVAVVFIVPRLTPARRVVAIGAMCALVLITLQLPGVANLVGERTDTAISTGGAGRTDIWSVGIGIVTDHPITGVGLANFAVAVTPERIRDTTAASQSAETIANQAAHNIVIGTFGELGIIGLILLAAFIGPLIFRRGWGPEAEVIQAAIASIFVLALFLDVMFMKQVWLFIGIGCGLAYLARTGGPRARQGSGFTPLPDRDR